MPQFGDPHARPHKKGRAKWTQRWKAPVNAFATTFEGRIIASARVCQSNGSGSFGGDAR